MRGFRDETTTMSSEDILYLVGVTMAGNDDQHLSGLEGKQLPIQLLIYRVPLGRQGDGTAQNGSQERSGKPTRRQNPTHPQDSHAGDREGHDRHACDRPDPGTYCDPLLEAVGHLGIVVGLEHVAVRVVHRNPEVLVTQAHSS